MAPLAKIFAVAVALALDVFAVAIGVGIRGIAPQAKMRIGVAFASAEVVMNLAGAGLGIAANKWIGPAAAYLGFVALMALGAYMITESRTELSQSSTLDLSRGWGLALASMSISLDSLGVGFSILYIGVPLVESLAIIAAVSIIATTLGLAIGGRIGAGAQSWAAFVGGLLLFLTGAAFAMLRALGGR